MPYVYVQEYAYTLPRSTLCRTARLSATVSPQHHTDSRLRLCRTTGRTHYSAGQYQSVSFRFEGRLRPSQRTRGLPEDRKSTRLNSSHVAISYAVVCLTNT